MLLSQVDVSLIVRGRVEDFVLDVRFQVVLLHHL
jgi:hypothetical protein